MANGFPSLLFPSYYSTGPPNGRASCNTGVSGWGEYGQVRWDSSDCQGEFVPLHCAKGENWEPVEGIPIPLLPPNAACRVPNVSIQELTFHGSVKRLPESNSNFSGIVNFTQQLGNFFLDHSKIAFGSMGRLLEENFYMGNSKVTGKKRETTIGIRSISTFLQRVQYQDCPMSCSTFTARQLSTLLGDLIYDIPPALLAENLCLEMKGQRNKLLFDEAATGGALQYIPVTDMDRTHEGWLLHPSGEAMNFLNFRKVVLHMEANRTPQLNAKQKAEEFELNGRILQISTSSVEEEVFVGVRSDYHCGVWRLSKAANPTPLQVVQTTQPATCINVSPHMAGELLVCSESGAVYLWSVETGLQRIHQEMDNLYFNAQSAWRWSDFTAHPRVITYADRTGLNLMDVRTPGVCSQTLFKIGEAAGCQKGERVILPKYLSDVHSYHHLITTQYSTYVLDERFPTVTMLKWNHMLQSPPMFAHVTPGASWDRANKVLLGSQRDQEVLLLQYKGGRQLPCQSLGPPRKLASPPDTLGYLQVQVPHRQEVVRERLHSPGAGLTAFSTCHGTEFLCVFQLSQAGDIFYQMLVNKDAEKEDESITETAGPRTEGPDVPAETVVTDEQQVSQFIIQGTVYTSDSNMEEEENAPFQEELVVNLVEGSNGEKDPAVTDQPGGRFSPVPPRDPAEGDGTPSKVQEAIGSCLQSARRTGVSNIALARYKVWQKKVRWAYEVKMQHPVLSTTLMLSTKDFHERFRGDPALYLQAREAMRTAMRERKVLSSDMFPSLGSVPVPDPVDPAAWPDQLSKRLTASWDGRWSDWWEEMLGMNVESKVEALRQKRKRQKQAQSRRRRGLSGSFTSSISFQSDLSDFSNVSGWSSLEKGSTSACSMEELSTSCTSASVTGSILKRPDRESSRFNLELQEGRVTEPVRSAAASSWDSVHKEADIGQAGSTVSLQPFEDDSRIQARKSMLDSLHSQHTPRKQNHALPTRAVSANLSGLSSEPPQVFVGKSSHISAQGVHQTLDHPGEDFSAALTSLQVTPQSQVSELLLPSSQSLHSQDMPDSSSFHSLDRLRPRISQNGKKTLGVDYLAALCDPQLDRPYQEEAEIHAGSWAQFSSQESFIPSSQSSSRNIPRTPVSSSQREPSASQPRKKKPRMGF
nr:PREDICTED: TATA box-binding protein-associated factor RNA polymerase I subunit C isoform X2 [Latimeria chalumnae]|eukprot:XP_006002712.1 PREDICTED: TATA box-binding protein-associated factor RNA polymerase I subunit C isoform X2 [Latimeria chalumnae]